MRGSRCRSPERPVRKFIQSWASTSAGSFTAAAKEARGLETDARQLPLPLTRPEAADVAGAAGDSVDVVAECKRRYGDVPCIRIWSAKGELRSEHDCDSYCPLLQKRIWRESEWRES